MGASIYLEMVPSPFLALPLLPTIRSLNPTALFVWMSRFVATAFPLTLSLSRKGRGNPRTASSYTCKPLYIPHSTLRIPHSARTSALYVHVKDTHGLSFSRAAHDRLHLPRAGGKGEYTRGPKMP